jgi:hypothetical protein
MFLDLPRSSSSKEERRDDLRELTIDCALEVDITFSFSLAPSLTGEGSTAISILFIFQATFSCPVMCISLLAFRKFCLTYPLMWTSSPLMCETSPNKYDRFYLQVISSGNCTAIWRRSAFESVFWIISLDLFKGINL